MIKDEVCPTCNESGSLWVCTRYAENGEAIKHQICHKCKDIVRIGKPIPKPSYLVLDIKL